MEKRYELLGFELLATMEPKYSNSSRPQFSQAVMPALYGETKSVVAYKYKGLLNLHFFSFFQQGTN